MSAAGFTLIELIMFVVIVSVGMVGILSVLDLTVRGSADPMIRKQMLAVAEGLLEEVSLMPYTYCDPDDPSATTAVNPAGCALAESLGPEVSGTAETRDGSPHFDNVNDYNGLSAVTTGINNTNTMPAGYTAGIEVIPEALNGISGTEALRIAVTVTHGGDTLLLEGYRTRHSPNLVP